MVYIIGTGPGDEELLTLKAVNTLKKCTAVLYDRLISNNIFNYLSEECETYYCGKAPGSHYMTQDQINKLMIDLAKAGHVVGRIKGGDPFVFGRGSEEALALIEEEINFEIIPGVTSPVAVLEYSGIPITHRNIARSFHIISGMSTGKLNIDFENLAKCEGTLVFMMGLSNLELIVDRLKSFGKNENTQVAVVMKGTTSKQKRVIGTLSDIVQKVNEEKLESPCIIAVGDVVKFSEKLEWMSKKPLFGKNICITRAKHQSEDLKRKLWNLGAEVTQINSIKIEPQNQNLDSYIEKLEKYDFAIFTSTNATNIFFDYLIEKKYDIRRLKAKFVAIGEVTQKAILKHGIVPFFVSPTANKEELFQKLRPFLFFDQNVVIPTSEKANNYLTESLESMGLNVDRINIYNTVQGKVINKNSFDYVDIVFFSSTSTVDNMVNLFGTEKIRTKQVYAIGPKTYNLLEKYNIESKICKKCTEDGFIEELMNNLK